MSSTRKNSKNPLFESRLILLGNKKCTFRHTFRWNSTSPSPEITRRRRFWSVESSASKEFMLKYLRLRFFWKLTSPLEDDLLFNCPEFIEDVEFEVLLLLVANTKFTRSDIALRSEKALSAIGRKSNFSFRLLNQWDNNIKLRAEEKDFPITRHKAFSGWVRNSSSVGTKSRGNFKAPEGISEEFSEVKFDEFKFLYTLISVGSYEANTGTIIKLS